METHICLLLVLGVLFVLWGHLLARRFARLPVMALRTDVLAGAAAGTFAAGVVCSIAAICLVILG